MRFDVVVYWALPDGSTSKSDNKRLWGFELEGYIKTWADSLKTIGCLEGHRFEVTTITESVA